MKKKILVGLAISSTFVFASQFQVIIKPESNKFMIGSYKDVTTKSDWQNIGEPTCTTDIQEDDIYYGLTAIQQSSCEQEQSQNVTLTREYDNGLSKILSEYVSYQDYAYNESNEITGTHLESSCKNILDSGYSIGDNKYHINTGNSTFERKIERNPLHSWRG